MKKTNQDTRTTEANEEIQGQFYEENDHENIPHIGFFIESVRHDDDHEDRGSMEDILKNNK